MEEGSRTTAFSSDDPPCMYVIHTLKWCVEPAKLDALADVGVVYPKEYRWEHS